MALHGEIKVNGQDIGWWSATRIGRDLSPTGINTYRTEVSMHGRTVKGQVTHRYDDGAARLASLALSLLPGKMP